MGSGEAGVGGQVGWSSVTARPVPGALHTPVPRPCSQGSLQVGPMCNAPRWGPACVSHAVVTVVSALRVTAIRPRGQRRAPQPAGSQCRLHPPHWLPFPAEAFRRRPASTSNPLEDRPGPSTSPAGPGATGHQRHIQHMPLPEQDESWKH